MEDKQPTAEPGENEEDRSRLATEKWRPFALLQHRATRQVSALFASGLFLRGFRLVTAPILTRTLGPDNYGTLNLFNSITAFVVGFFGLGLFSTAGMLLANTPDEEDRRRLIGVSLILGLIVGVAYAAAIFGLSFFIDDWFNCSLGGLLRCICLLLVFLPFGELTQLIGRGTNRIGALVWIRVFPVLAWTGIVFTLWASGLMLLGWLIPFRASLALFPFVLLLLAFRPAFKNLRQSARRLFQKNREFGIHLYIARVVESSGAQLTALLLPVFHAPAQLGYFTVPAVLAQAIVSLSRSLATVQYRQYAQQSKIAQRVLYLNYLYLLASCLGFIFLGKFVILLIAGNQFMEATTLVYPMALSAFLRGAYQPYNHFLSAKGRGPWMRNASFLTSAVAAVSSLSLIPVFGAYGAAWASVSTVGTFYVAVLHYYRRHQRSLGDAKTDDDVPSRQGE